MATAQLSERIRADWTVFFFATPYPGTDLWRSTVGEQGSRWPSWGERWNNRVGPAPWLGGALSPERLAWWRGRLQNRHFARNYLRARNVPFMARLARTLPEPEVRRAVGRLVRHGGRADDVVEAAFSAWRAA